MPPSKSATASPSRVRTCARPGSSLAGRRSHAGTVIQIDDFGRGALSPDLSVATVVWGDHEPTRIDVKDLVREDHSHLEPVGPALTISRHFG